MADLILHHYLTSPFSEKVRLILGAKKLPWKSVFIPPIMPKPDVEVLTGGYRKTPFLQIGADIYCDSALIADVLEHLRPEPTLYPEPEKGMKRLQNAAKPYRVPSWWYFAPRHAIRAMSLEASTPGRLCACAQSDAAWTQSR